MVLNCSPMVVKPTKMLSRKVSVSSVFNVSIAACTTVRARLGSTELARGEISMSTRACSALSASAVEVAASEKFSGIVTTAA